MRARSYREKKEGGRGTALEGRGGEKRETERESAIECCLGQSRFQIGWARGAEMALSPLREVFHFQR